MPDKPPYIPPAYNPKSGTVIFPIGPEYPSFRDQIVAYYEANFRPQQMESFARFVIEQGFGAYAPKGRKDKDGHLVPETWQACGQRLYGDRFIDVMKRVVAEYRAAHGAPPAAASSDPPAHVLERIPDPDF